MRKTCTIAAIAVAAALPGLAAAQTSTPAHPAPHAHTTTPPAAHAGTTPPAADAPATPPTGVASGVTLDGTPDPTAQVESALAPIDPQNALERTFVAAVTDPSQRPVFRSQLLESQVVLALATSAADSAPREVPLRAGVSATLIFTSAARMDSVLGSSAPRVSLSGRDALQRLHGKNVIINPTLAPMLTLEPDDVAHWLAVPAAPSAPQP
jgi:hypothetical protein